MYLVKVLRLFIYVSESASEKLRQKCENVQIYFCYCPSNVPTMTSSPLEPTRPPHLRVSSCKGRLWGGQTLGFCEETQNNLDDKRCCVH